MSEKAEAQELDDTEPTPERQAELRAAYDANVAAGKAPYEGVRIGTRGELFWVMQERGWSGESFHPAGFERVNLSGAVLTNANLNEARLVEANLTSADLRSAFLRGATLSGATLHAADLALANLSMAQLVEANLTGAVLRGADLTQANLAEASLDGADLRTASLCGTRLRSTVLSGADLRWARMDGKTELTNARLDTNTCLADMAWDGAAVARLNWTDFSVLGDEHKARQETERAGKNKDAATRLSEYQDAVHANRQVAILLRGQGLNEHADDFAFRAQLCQREVLRRQAILAREPDSPLGQTIPFPEWVVDKLAPYLGSLLLDLIAGYGYKLWRVLITYSGVVLLFSLVFWKMGIHSFPHESSVQAFWDSFLVSLSAIHGRTTFEQLGAWSLAAWAAAVESVVGIVIEGVFVAMLVQRFFAR